MPHWCHRTSRRAQIGVLIVLLLVPLALAAHTHQGSVASDSCATCAAVHHTPTLATSQPDTAESPLRPVAFVIHRCSVRAVADRAAPSGRGPPTLAVS